MTQPAPELDELEQAFQDDEEAETAIQPVEKKIRVFHEKKIQDEWMPEIMVWAAQGDSYQKIANKIKDKWGVSITAPGIRRSIKKVAADRSSTSKSVLRNNIGQYIISDLQILKDKKQELVGLAAQFKLDKDWKNYYMAIDRIKEYSKMLFELSGVHEAERNDDAENAKSDLLDMFERYTHLSRVPKE